MFKFVRLSLSHIGFDATELGTADILGKLALNQLRGVDRG